MVDCTACTIYQRNFMNHVHCSSSGSYAPVGSTTTFHYTPKVHTSSESLKSLSVESRHCRKVQHTVVLDIKTTLILHQTTIQMSVVTCKVDIASNTSFRLHNEIPEGEEASTLFKEYTQKSCSFQKRLEVCKTVIMHHCIIIAHTP